jgi:hypothetical protein
MQSANNAVTRLNEREDDTNLGWAEELCSSVIKASEGKTGVHLVNVPMK